MIKCQLVKVKVIRILNYVSLEDARFVHLRNIQLRDINPTENIIVIYKNNQRMLDFDCPIIKN